MTKKGEAVGQDGITVESWGFLGNNVVDVTVQRVSAKGYDTQGMETRQKKDDIQCGANC